MDAGVLDWMMNQMNGVTANALTALLPLIYKLLGFCALLTVAVTLMVLVGEESLLFLWALIKILMGFGLVTAAVANWQPLTTVLAATASVAGLSIAGNQLSVDQFMSPGQLAVEGSRITNKMEEWLNTLGWTSVYKPHLILSMSLMTTFTSVVWVLMGMNTLVSVWLFKLLVPIGFIGLAFMISSSLRWFGFSLVRLLVASSMQIFSLAAWTSVLILIVPALILTQIADISLWRVTLIFAASFFLFCFTIIMPFVVAAGAFVASGMTLVRPLKTMVHKAV
jgi:hypothetical protein